MSDQPVTLDLLGRVVRDLQTDVRDLRGRVGVLEMDMIGLKTAVVRMGDAVAAGFQEIGESNRRLEAGMQELLARTGA